ncbi:DNA topoisomerase I [Ardenticatena maritima]|uniref:DNA topoisomerase 1 n=1 Tax=Ardenticatena maritima TaxID=872965 RepID=A0A0M9UDV6_9CHLR|nr:type I DNA topoisomerase [Ardenticatena maritima]GAP64464.1 DNA topoisomerase I [Ardenticatena maritima]
MSEPIQAYCMKCKTKREMRDPQPVFTENGRPATRGTCPVCGTTLFRMGATPAHEGLTPPPPKPTTKKEKKASRKRRSTTSATSGEKSGAQQGKGNKLVIVESPAKARTIGKYLGRGYTVRASLGHVRDLLKSQLSVDIENNFEPTYRVPNEKRALVKELKSAAQKASEIYLATDPDREGEAIAWHLLESMDVPQERARRVVFHEITKNAIQEAFQHPRQIDMQLVNAQQARRILDRLVGYQISPLLWRNVRSRLSAGRVQSVALRMVVEREREIRAFTPEEYWTIEAFFAQMSTRGQDPRPSFKAKLVRVNGKEPHLPNADAAQAILNALQGAQYVITDVRQKQRRRRPSAPFTTSTMQQEASRRLGFGARKTMQIAQQLYEGIDIGDGVVGLITYMRTDSVNVSREAQAEARDYIHKTFGETYVPAKPPVYKTRAKQAQEAHEAIRPTSVWRTPDSIKQYLSRDQYRLYELIWKRFVASQMAPAILDTTSVDIVADTEGRVPADAEQVDETLRAALARNPAYLFRASGSVVRFPGFLVLYEEARDEDAPEEENIHLPDLHAGEHLDALDVQALQHFTQPPPRYTEATLVRALEEHGIGRPSTYAPIISTLQSRGYVRKESKRLVPTELGEVVTDLLVEHFPEVMDIGFTARMEEELDQIAEGKREWVQVLRDFYGPFSQRLATAQKEMQSVQVEEDAGETCEKCGSPMIIKYGRYGKFIACSNFPECRNTKPYQEKIGVQCPECGGDIVEKRTRRGRIFYGCANYPECEWSSWKRPLPVPCPDCGGLLVEANRTTVQCLACEETFSRADIEALQEATE